MRLPRTSESRRDPGFLKLITDVDVYAPPGLQFRCTQLLSPGAEFNPATLPRPAVLLEYGGRVRIAQPRSRYSFSSLWLLWRFDFETSEWIEVVRATSDDTAFSLDFAPIAKRLLDQEREHVSDRARPFSDRVVAAVGAELALMTREIRCQVLAALDQFVASEIDRHARAASGIRGSEPTKAGVPAS